MWQYQKCSELVTLKTKTQKILASQIINRKWTLLNLLYLIELEIELSLTHWKVYFGNLNCFGSSAENATLIEIKEADARDVGFLKRGSSNSTIKGLCCVGEEKSFLSGFCRKKKCRVFVLSLLPPQFRSRFDKAKRIWLGRLQSSTDPYF